MINLHSLQKTEQGESVAMIKCCSIKLSFVSTTVWYVSLVSLQISEERLSRVLQETQEQHEREISKMQSMLCHSVYHSIFTHITCCLFTDHAVKNFLLQYYFTTTYLLFYSAQYIWSAYTRVLINRLTHLCCSLFPGSLSQRKEQTHCRKECSDTLSKLQKKNQELQRHLEKACRQLQHSVREHKSAIQHLRGLFL